MTSANLCRDDVERVLADDSPESTTLIDSNLSGVDLSHLDLSKRNLSGANLRGANLSHSDLSGTNLSGAHLSDAVLYGTKLIDAELIGADAEAANFSGCDASRAGFGGTNLEGTNFFEANLSGATMSHARLARADFRCVEMRGARLHNADLSGVDASSADFREVEFDDSQVGNASFHGADLRGARMKAVQGFEQATFIEADIRDTDFRGAYSIRRFIIDENYLWEFRNRGPGAERLYKLWWITSDCGRSFWRWGGWTLALVVLFAVAYTFVGVDYGEYETVLSPLYYSVVTLTTLGYGDVLPKSATAQIVAMCEVIVGYVALGGLLSILANKMGRRGE